MSERRNSMSLDELEALLDKATPGPWDWEQGRKHSTLTPSFDTHGDLVLYAGEGWEDDAELIVALRNEAPRLIAALRAVEKLADEMYEFAHTTGPCTGPQCAGCQSGRWERAIRQALAGIEVDR